MKWAVIGCGYTGQRLVRRLLGAGHRVTAATVREPAAAQALAGRLGVPVAALDLSDASLPLHAVIHPGSVVVDSAPPTPPPGRAEKRLVQACARAGAARIVYLSSTGVYPAARGEWIDAGRRVRVIAIEGNNIIVTES